MTLEAKKTIRIYILLTLLSTLAASFIWGINTLFLLDAGLSNTEAFTANAFFTIGQVIFEVPTGVVADVWGRRTSFMLGAATLIISTLLYLLMWQLEAPFIGWAISSITIGLGFTFFSGATEAWLVDALDANGYKDDLESVFAKGQVTGGIAMLVGSVAGGFIAQATNLGIPYAIRAAMLLIALSAAFFFMKDVGFKPEKTTDVKGAIKTLFKASIDNGLRKREVRWAMLTAPFSAGIGIFAFYAMQPYLLELYGDPEAYGIAGLAAAILAGAQIAGGLLVPFVRNIASRRTSVLLFTMLYSIVALVTIGLFDNFWIVIGILVTWAMTFAASGPIRAAYLNSAIPSKQRATILSFDSLVGSAGAVVSQPSLGRVADVYSFSTAYVVGGLVQLGAIPFLLLQRRDGGDADKMEKL